MLNIGIVGLGRIGKIHLSNVQRYMPNANVIAACPVKKKRIILKTKWSSSSLRVL